MGREELRSWDEIRERMPQIVARLNQDEALAIAAAANPFIALSGLGYVVAPEARPGIEDRLRFSPAAAKERGELRERVYGAAGHSFCIESSEELARVLFGELKLTPYPDERGCIPPLPDTSPLRRFHEGEAPPRDPLEPLRGKHPIIEPLLAYRRLDASRPRFAPQAAYSALLKRETGRAVVHLHVRFQDKPDSGGGGRSPDSPADPPARTPARRLDLNTATPSELELLPGMSLKLAKRILAYRNEHGPFADLRDILAITGVSERLFTQIEPHLTL